MSEIWGIVVATVVGGSGILGLIFYFFRRSIEKILNKKEEEAKKQCEIRKRRRSIEDELWHATGRLFFWLNRWADTGEHNGELENAFRKYEAAEELKKQLDRDIIAEHEGD